MIKNNLKNPNDLKLLSDSVHEQVLNLIARILFEF